MSRVIRVLKPMYLGHDLRGISRDVSSMLRVYPAIWIKVENRRLLGGYSMALPAPKTALLRSECVARQFVVERNQFSEKPFLPGGPQFNLICNKVCNSSPFHPVWNVPFGLPIMVVFNQFIFVLVFIPCRTQYLLHAGPLRI